MCFIGKKKPTSFQVCQLSVEYSPVSWITIVVYDKADGCRYKPKRTAADETPSENAPLSVFRESRETVH